MRILIAAGIYPPDVGGPATHVKKIAEGLSDKNIGVELTTYGPAGVSRKIPFGIRHFIYFLNCLVRGWKSDLVYAQDVTAAGLPAFLAAKLLRKKFFVRVGGDLLWERVVEKKKRFLTVKEYYRAGLHLNDYPVLYRLVRYLLSKSAAIIVPTSFLKNLYVDFYGVSPEKIKVILNPLTNLPVEKPKTTDQPIILFAGRFVAYKNLKFLIKVFNSVWQENNRGLLYLIGEGPEKDNLENFAKGLPSTGQIKILPVLERDRLLREIQSAALCVGPALTEFNPNFILECLSLKKPVLLSRENGLSVPLPEEFLFDPKNEEELRKKLTDLLNPAHYRSAVDAVSNFNFQQTWQNVIDQHIEILR